MLTVQVKLNDVYFRLRQWLFDERGQTATEYTLMVAVGAALAIGVVWLLLSATLQGAIEDITLAVDGFIGNIFPPEPEPVP